MSLLITAVVFLTAITPAVLAQTAVLDLGSGEEAVIGLHVTADVLREATEALPDETSDLVLLLDTPGGFFDETPALAELLARRLPARFTLALVVREASSTGAVIALAPPTLAIRHDGFLGGHAPFERLGEIDLDLIESDLEVALLVAEKCAELGDRPKAVARALMKPTPLALDDEGNATNDPFAGEVVHDGSETLVLNAREAVRVGAADIVIPEGIDPVAMLGLPVRISAPDAQAVLDEHRARIAEHLLAFRETLAALREQLESPLDPEGHTHALERLGELEGVFLTDPRVALFHGIDTPALDGLETRIREQRSAYARTPPTTMEP